MEKKFTVNPNLLQLEQARQLLDLGHPREALSLAVDVLMEELHHLRESMVSLQNLIRPDAWTGTKTQPATFGRLPGKRLRTLH